MAVAVSGTNLNDAIGQSLGAQEAAASGSENPASEAELATPSAIDGIDRVASALEAERNDSESQRHARDDLRAQQEMAKWAFWMFVATSVTVLISVVGLFMVWRTLVFTGLAATHTKDMLAEAKKTARAAELAVKATQDASVIQIRPWLDIDIRPVGDPVYDGDELKIRVSISAKNHGKSPAMGVKIFAEALSDTDDEIEVLKRIHGEQSGGFLAAPVLFPEGVSLPLKKTLSFAARGTGDVHILVYAGYKLSSGGKKRHFTEYIYTYAWMKPDGSPAPLRDAPDGVQIDTMIFRSGGGMNT